MGFVSITLSKVTRMCQLQSCASKYINTDCSQVGQTMSNPISLQSLTYVIIVMINFIRYFLTYKILYSILYIMNTLMPRTVSVSDIQKNYRKIFDTAKETKEPVIVLSNNKPDVAIIDYSTLESLRRIAYEAEIKDTLRVVKEGRKEYKEGKTIKAKSLADLI